MKKTFYFFSLLIFTVILAQLLPARSKNAFGETSRVITHSRVTTTQLSKSEANNYQVKGDRQGKVIVQDATGKVIHTFQMDPGVVVRETFLLNQGTVVAASQKDHTDFWDLQTGQLIRRFDQRIYGFSYDETKVFISSNETLFEASNDNAVEVDNIRFEIIVPERTWIIPEDKPNAETNVEINLKITNRNPTPIRFHYPEAILKMVKADGIELRVSGGRAGLPYSQEFVCRTVVANQSLMLFSKAKLFWRDQKLYLQGLDGVSGVWSYKNLQPGAYQIRLIFSGFIPSSLCRDPNSSNSVRPKLIKGFWTGEVTTPFVEVKIVNK